MASDQPPNETKPFRLLDLPPELWARIIQIAVTKPETLEHDAAERPVNFRTPAVAKTSQAIRTEALKAYYQHNKFQIICECNDNELKACQDWAESRMTDGYWNAMRPLQVVMCCMSADDMAREFQARFPSNKISVKFLRWWKYGPAWCVFEVSMNQEA